jgi:hypothetical protein
MKNSKYIGKLPGQIVLYGPQPIDLHYGPYTDIYTAYAILYDPDQDINNVYYGKTIGVYRYDDQHNIIGVDEWWWQPNCVKSKEDDSYVDGFVLKFPANNVNTVSETVSQKVLSLGDDYSDFNSKWKDDTSGEDVNWNPLEQEQKASPDISDIIEREEP